MPQILQPENQPPDLPVTALVVRNVVPLRAEPKGGSEQVSQAILGDRVTLLDEQDDYVLARMADDYEGWMWHSHVCPWPESAITDWRFALQSGPLQSKSLQSKSLQSGPLIMEASEAAALPFRYVSCGAADLYGRPNAANTLLTKLVFGTWCRVLEPPISLNQGDSAATGPLLRVATPLLMPGAGSAATTVGYLDACATLPASERGYQGDFCGETACALAMQFIGIPYLWGGTTPFGFDCSGFVQRIYSMLNVPLPRDAYLQIHSPLGVQCTPQQTPEAGDLVFFCGRSDPRKRGITHVGMALNAERFIHASGRLGVAVTSFDEPVCRAETAFVGTWRYCACANSTDSLAG